MLIKTGDRIFNTDYLISAEFEAESEDDPAYLTLYFSHIASDSHGSESKIKLDNGEAVAVWNTLSREATEVTETET